MVEADSSLPELKGQTVMMTDEHRRALSLVLPPRAIGNSWTLIYNSDENGFALGSLYHRMRTQPQESPVLFLIQDSNGNVFGAMTSCLIRLSNDFYGSGESFLFTFYPQFETFRWNGGNNYFIKGNVDSLMFGSDNGANGLFVSEDLFNGRSEVCCTYNNRVLAPQQDFLIKNVEAWGFFE